MSRVDVEERGEALVITLDAPAEGNRLSEAMFVDLDEAVARASQRAGLRAVLLQANGASFSVGGAIDEFAGEEPLDALLARTLPTAHRVAHRLSTLPCPLVCAVQGAVAGGAIGLALSGDMVLAADDTVFRAGYPGIGLSPDVGTSWHLLRRAGPTFTAGFLMTNRRVDAAEALRVGLVTAVHPATALRQEALDLVDSLAGGPTRSHRAVRELIAAFPANDLDTHLAMEERLMVACGGSDDARNAVEAFLTRRKPEFGGR